MIKPTILFLASIQFRKALGQLEKGKTDMSKHPLCVSAALRLPVKSPFSS
jgi:hypothetical protein